MLSNFKRTPLTVTSTCDSGTYSTKHCFQMSKSCFHTANFKGLVSLLYLIGHSWDLYLAIKIFKFLIYSEICKIITYVRYNSRTQVSPFYSVQLSGFHCIHTVVQILLITNHFQHPQKKLKTHHFLFLLFS